MKLCAHAKLNKWNYTNNLLYKKMIHDHDFSCHSKSDYTTLQWELVLHVQTHSYVNAHRNTQFWFSPLSAAFWLEGSIGGWWALITPAVQCNALLFNPQLSLKPLHSHFHSICIPPLWLPTHEISRERQLESITVITLFILMANIYLVKFSFMNHLFEVTMFLK